MFKLFSAYKPKGDQPQAIKKLAAGVESGKKYQTLLGVTGSGKTFSIASVIEKLQRPALIISHNKTLAAQLFQEFKEFFPENSVHYFVSYYDYYQPEAYLPATDTYIGKDAKINDFIDQLRHASLQGILTESNFIIVASVSCIYGIGEPEEYRKMGIELKISQEIKRREILKRLVLLQYEKDGKKIAGSFKTRGDLIEINPPDGETKILIELLGNKIEGIQRQKETSKENLKQIKIFPAKFFVSEREKLKIALANIREELKERLKELKKQKKFLEAERLEERTNYDLEILQETGYVNGIENYSRHLSFRAEGEPPYTLIDYLPENALIIIDESHMTIPQLKGMYEGDKARKQVLIDYGFRLPSALDNRPLNFKEFEEKNKNRKFIFISATPGPYENSRGNIAEQLVRPTGLLDPKIHIKPLKNQIHQAIEEIKKGVENRERVLLLTLTKKGAEDVSLFLKEKNIRAEYLHSDIKTIERTKTLRALRAGEFDVLVGINLLREGLDLPEVALTLVLDADKEGYLRNATSLIQTIGRASRHPNGRAILFADKMTKSIKETIAKTAHRRKIQEKYNKIQGIVPAQIFKPLPKPFWIEKIETAKEKEYEKLLKDLQKKIKNPAQLKIKLEEIMLRAADELDFEKAAKIRDLMKNV